MQRIEQHPILSIAEAAEFTFTCDGKEVTAREGETVAAALIANGIRHIHVYSMNKPDIAEAIFHNLSEVIHE